VSGIRCYLSLRKDTILHGQSVGAHVHLRALLLADRPQLTPALPHSGHRFPQFFVRDVQVPLRLLDVGMAEHQLDRPDVHVLCQEATRALVTEVVPMQVDLPQLGAIDACTGSRALRLVPVGDQSNDSQAVLKMYAFGPRDARRFKTGARRPCGSNGMRRFSASFACRPGMAIWCRSQSTCRF